ncbi:MAG: cytochrome c4 [Pseudomonadales bacterium]|nr:cytochrome c4 [Pseudomonadales bacterium]
MYRLIILLILTISVAQVKAEGDVSRGKALTNACVACHGVDGNSPAGAFPSIAGQHTKYLLKQLNDIKTKKRAAPLMTGLLDNMSAQDLEDIAAYFADQKHKTGAAKAELVKLGESIYRAGIKRKKIAACSACHLPQGEGLNLAGFPALAGQWPEYIEAQLKAFRTGARDNDGEGRMMRNTALDLSDEEIAAVASYIYGLK